MQVFTASSFLGGTVNLASQMFIPIRMFDRKVFFEKIYLL